MLPEAAIKPTENSKPFTRQRKPFALSWAWEYILYLPYCSLKNQSFPCFPSFHPLPWLHIFWLPSGVWQERPEVWGAATHILPTSQERPPVSVSRTSQLRVASFQSGAASNPKCLQGQMKPLGVS